MNDAGHLDQSAREPFASLFTQGMVCHETYQTATGAWASPDEVDRTGDGATLRSTGEPVTIGPVIKMSKSKRNVVDPEEIIESYGADTVRWFMLSDSPPERDVEWTAAGVDGSWRFVQRVWRLVEQARHITQEEERDTPLARAAHRAIAGVTDDIEHFRFNKAIARLYTLAGEIEGSDEADPARRRAADILIRLMYPFTPHLSEEAAELLGAQQVLAESAWPTARADFLVEDTIVLPVQINGKKRGEIAVPADASQKEIEAAALAYEPVAKHLSGATPKRVIVVPKRIVNVVV